MSACSLLGYAAGEEVVLNDKMHDMAELEAGGQLKASDSEITWARIIAKIP